ncbi:MAG: tRNA pseudouridine(38-40) synthase TruA [Chitinophagaceae bacterium]|nr:tRNA pseudouridine(38-40) synthase TruA [Chitinophagaceae bacterium]MCW5905605.1 tRNA pseudouridine(38-40) synthase TruA [Chitinophagaceae bacterium]
MPRYFIEVAYLGTNYSGFQVQKNANSIQSEIEKALHTVVKKEVKVTGSSRTDAGVHALQNYFHFDEDEVIDKKKVYNLNAVLPFDITVKSLSIVKPNAHARFDAIAREYKYFISPQKNPFSVGKAWLYPYKINMQKLQKAAAILLEYNNFQSFSKKHTQVNNYLCTLQLSEWYYENDLLVYHVKGNRFLRGMIKGLVSTMLLVGRNKISEQDFIQIIEANNNMQADFTAPSEGLFLCSVQYPDEVFESK